MTQEDKQLLLKDLCGRLPYGVIVQYESQENKGRIKLGFGNIGYVDELGKGWWKECKPYLRPMSSMTEEELIELNKIGNVRLIYSSRHSTYHLDAEIVDYLVAHHFDYRGLIPIGLALEAPKDMYKTE